MIIVVIGAVFVAFSFPKGRHILTIKNNTGATIEEITVLAGGGNYSEVNAIENGASRVIQFTPCGEGHTRIILWKKGKRGIGIHVDDYFTRGGNTKGEIILEEPDIHIWNNGMNKTNEKEAKKT